MSLHPVADTMTIGVRVSEGLAPMAADIAERLGHGFDVTVGGPTRGGIAVLGAMGREAVAFFHVQHPETVLLVVKRGATGHDDEAADYLDAGADQFLEAGSPDEIALQIRVLTRRLHHSARTVDPQTNSLRSSHASTSIVR